MIDQLSTIRNGTQQHLQSPLEGRRLFPGELVFPEEHNEAPTKADNAHAKLFQRAKLFQYVSVAQKHLFSTLHSQHI